MMPRSFEEKSAADAEGSVLADIARRAKLVRAHLVLPEGEDPRVAAAAIRAQAEGIARITLLGNADKVTTAMRAAGAKEADFLPVIDPLTSSKQEEFARTFHGLPHGRRGDMAKAVAMARSNLGFAALMVHLGEADGTLGGALATTADTIRTAVQIIGRAPGAKLVSSFFLMLLPDALGDMRRAVVFADCALVVDPSAERLAAIARDSARSFTGLTGTRAKVAMLSFSSHGSATHPMALKVAEATGIARLADPELLIEGEVQFDAAFAPEVARKKLTNPVLDGDANVFVFPNLDAGNIGYKIAQRIGGAQAVGPILQGLAKPANDLSRGASEADIFNMIAVTGLQAMAAAE
jgi:phosphate acetyltransferase